MRKPCEICGLEVKSAYAPKCERCYQVERHIEFYVRYPVGQSIVETAIAKARLAGQFNPPRLSALVGGYCNIISKLGTGSKDAKIMRNVHKNNKEFIEYADALDAIKTTLGGSGNG